MSRPIHDVRGTHSKGWDAMLTLTSALRSAVRVYGRNIAIIDAEGRFTWAQFVNRVARAASVLRSRGVKRGDRYGIICRNSFRNAELIHAGYCRATAKNRSR